MKYESPYDLNMRHAKEQAELDDRHMEENLEMLRQDNLLAQQEYEEQHPPSTKEESIGTAIVLILGGVLSVLYLYATSGAQ